MLNFIYIPVFLDICIFLNGDQIFTIRFIYDLGNDISGVCQKNIKTNPFINLFNNFYDVLFLRIYGNTSATY